MTIEPPPSMTYEEASTLVVEHACHFRREHGDYPSNLVVHDTVLKTLLRALQKYGTGLLSPVEKNHKQDTFMGIPIRSLRTLPDETTVLSHL